MKANNYCIICELIQFINIQFSLYALLFYFVLRMTGVGGRPEVIIEGSNSLDKGWKEYHFLYKPGNVSSPLPIVGKFSNISQAAG